MQIADIQSNIFVHLPFTVTLLLLLLTARVLGEIFERMGHPAMIGEILSGFILGPSVLHLVGYSNEIRVLSELGIFFLIVLAGMEIRPEEIRKSVKGKNALIAVMGFVIPMIFGLLIGFLLDMDWLLTLFIGLCIAITALPVSVRILMDLGKLNTDIGQKIISAAIFNDVVALLILGIILDSADPTASLSTILISTFITIFKVGVFTVIIYLVYKVVQVTAYKIPIIQNRITRLLAFLKGKESLFALIIAFVLVFSSISEVLGLHFVVGAFFGAMLLNKEFLGSDNFEKIKNNTSGISMGFLSPIFFASIGLQFNLMSINNFTLLALILVASFASKILGGYIGGRLAGLSNLRSYTLGIGLNARGIMELVIANIALQNGFIDSMVYSILVLMGIVTTLVSPYFLKKCFHRIDRLEPGNGTS
ncbi:MAG: cation:proton antiporter [Bacteroidetes bacterium]|nr:cation:proton antiporter [Bacteroidota bacterium]